MEKVLKIFTVVDLAVSSLNTVLADG